MRRLGIALALLLLLVTVPGCKKQVPDDIVKKGMTSVLRSHASNLVSAMCGAKSQGITFPNIAISKRGENNTGVAHVKGSPTFYTGKPPTPTCEGDIEYSYEYTTRTYGPSKRRKTVTTWYLKHMKLLAIQTPGVTSKSMEEDPEGDDDDDAQ